MLAAASANPTFIYVAGTVVGGIVLGMLTWVAGSLLKHAQILAVVSLAIPQIQQDMRVHGAQISALEVSQARTEALLGYRSAATVSSVVPQNAGP
jgi:hypothetical protein